MLNKLAHAYQLYSHRCTLAMAFEENWQAFFHLLTSLLKKWEGECVPDRVLDQMYDRQVPPWNIS